MNGADFDNRYPMNFYISSAGREKVLSRLRVEKSPISASRVRKSYLGFTWKKVLSQLRA